MATGAANPLHRIATLLSANGSTWPAIEGKIREIAEFRDISTQDAAQAVFQYMQSHPAHVELAWSDSQLILERLQAQAPTSLNESISHLAEKLRANHDRRTPFSPPRTSVPLRSLVVEPSPSPFQTSETRISSSDEDRLAVAQSQQLKIAHFTTQCGYIKSDTVTKLSTLCPQSQLSTLMQQMKAQNQICQSIQPKPSLLRRELVTIGKIALAPLVAAAAYVGLASGAILAGFVIDLATFIVVGFVWVFTSTHVIIIPATWPLLAVTAVPLVFVIPQVLMISLVSGTGLLLIGLLYLLWMQLSGGNQKKQEAEKTEFEDRLSHPLEVATATFDQLESIFKSKGELWIAALDEEVADEGLQISKNASNHSQVSLHQTKRQKLIAIKTDLTDFLKQIGAYPPKI